MWKKLTLTCLVLIILMLLGCAGTKQKPGETPKPTDVGGKESDERQLIITGKIVQQGSGDSLLVPSPGLHLIVTTSPASETVIPDSDGTFRITHGLTPYTTYAINALVPGHPALGSGIKDIQLGAPGELKEVGYILLGIPYEEPTAAIDLKKRVDRSRGEVKPGDPGH
jgi:hypothetical protein